MEISKFFDAYELRARLAPVLLVLLPLIFTTVAWFPALKSSGGAIMGLLIVFSLLLLTHFNREAGKRLEASLFKEWGGKPTTMLLRYRDQTLDLVTKKRYHTYLRKVVPGLGLPDTPEQERENPKEYEDNYESAVRWLREKTRDKDRYPLVFEENVSYGFRRNFLSLRPWGIAIAALTLLGNFVGIYFRYGQNIQGIPPEIVVSTLLSLTFVVIFLFLVRPNWVRTAANEYAHALLAACESTDPGR